LKAGKTWRLAFEEGKAMIGVSRRTVIRRAVALGALGSLASVRIVAADNPPRIGIVGKIRIPWFENLERGVKNAAEELGIEAWTILPSSDDPAHQIRAVEDLIARKVQVIGVIPNNGAALESVFKRAQEAGIRVIVHEQPGQKNADWDIELVQSRDFGEAHLEALAAAIGAEGKYVVYVGGPTVTLHNLWADAAVELQKRKYPKMQQVGERFAVSNSVEDSYKTAVDQMHAHPDLAGFLAFGARGPIGAGQAVVDLDRIGKVIVVGTFVPSQGQKLMKAGAITRGFIWSPLDAGYAMVQLGNLLAKGQEPIDGMDVPGLGAVKVEPDTRVVRADKMLDINPNTIDELAKLI
jgi:simple sugar transport system substrate-binding protein